MDRITAQSGFGALLGHRSDLAAVQTLRGARHGPAHAPADLWDGVSIHEVAGRTARRQVPVLRSTAVDAHAQSPVSREKTLALAAALGATAEELPAWERVAAELFSFVPPRRGELEKLW
jgi:hypothetical protein